MKEKTKDSIVKFRKQLYFSYYLFVGTHVVVFGRRCITMGIQLF